MKIVHISFALAALTALGTMTAAMAQSAGEPASAAANALNTAMTGDADGAFAVNGKFSEPDGEKLYKRVCAGCHMPDGKGAQGAGHYPALVSNANMAAGGYPLMVVMKGLNGMPAVGTDMSDQQVADVVNYVRTHFSNNYKDAVSAADAKMMR